MNKLKDFISMPTHLTTTVIVGYSLFKGHITLVEFLLVMGFMLMFSVIGATKRLWT